MLHDQVIAVRTVFDVEASLPLEGKQRNFWVKQWKLVIWRIFCCVREVNSTLEKVEHGGKSRLVRDQMLWRCVFL